MRESDPVDASSSMSPRILTAYIKGMHPAWISRIEISQKLSDDAKRNWGKNFSPFQKLRHDLTLAWWMFRESRNYDLVYAGSDWDGLFFSIGQRLFRRNKVPNIFIDFLVNIDENRLGK